MEPSVYPRCTQRAIMEAKTMQETALLELRGICKYFPGVRALDGVDFTLRKGEIHALMGENGAGKSTLIKVLTGVYSKDEGTISMEGTPVQIRSTQDALKAGISTVYQEITLCPNLTVAENLYIGRTKGAFTNWRKMNAGAKKLLDSLGIPAAPTQQLSSCSIAVQQMVAIARAVDMECKVLILDEPTSSLDEQEVEKLFGLMLDLKSRGVGIIFVTHFWSRSTPSATASRSCATAGSSASIRSPSFRACSSCPRCSARSWTICPRSRAIPLPTRLKTRRSSMRRPGFRAPRASARSIFHPQGRGQRLYGTARLRPQRIRARDLRRRPRLRRHGADERKDREDHIAPRRHENGISYLPEDRKRDGIIGDLSVRDNIILARQVLDGFFHPISKAKAEKYAQEYIKLLNIKTASTETPIKALSGGNQQKVILARWLLANPVYMILDEPTRGIDVGTKVEIQKLVLKLAAEGKSVTFISSEIDEMLRVCSRLVVMRDRQVVGELRGSDLNQSSIMKTIAGGEQA